jgi:hypothetical protein
VITTRSAGLVPEPRFELGRGCPQRCLSSGPIVSDRISMTVPRTDRPARAIDRSNLDPPDATSGATKTRPLKAQDQERHDRRGGENEHAEQGAAERKTEPGFERRPQPDIDQVGVPVGPPDRRVRRAPAGRTE